VRAEGISLDAAARRAAELVLDRLDELAEGWLERMWTDPDYQDWARPEVRQTTLDNARRDIGREVAALVDGFALPLSCPEEVADSARLAVSWGFPLSGVLQSYRTGHAVQWQAWLDAVESLGLPDEQRIALLQRGSAFFFEYADRCAKWSESAYTEERERRLRGREQRRTQMVRDVLGGAQPDAAQLDYEVERHHMAVIAWGRDPDAAIDRLAGEHERPMLRVAADRETAWAWLGSDESWTDRELRALERVVPPAGTRLALGGPARGVDGFRRAHDEARQARRIAARRPGPVTMYDEVGLLALSGQDEPRARAFVEHELGPLFGDDERSQVLRATLRAYIETGLHAAAAAALLGVHERTVANRVRAAEERLGRPVAARSVELGAALRLYDLLDAGLPDS
jgi:diguanylate cyclase with GGDEF domain/PucR-like helix-turn-helix protein